jgi:hypothetical protein
VIEAPESDLREIAPYTQAEYKDALERLLVSPVLSSLIKAYFPGVELSSFVKMAKGLATVDEFQARVIAPAIDSMLKQGSDGITLTGLEHITRERKYLYISNHRDIICDPALLTQRLCVNGYGTPKICLGDNLLTSPFVVDLIKMNKGVTVKRGLSPRELLRWSQALSEGIRRSIASGEDSVWIAQREGRTKDGDDQTQPGVLKMLAMAGEGLFIERISALHVVPVAVSYEYDPCDLFKARGLHCVATRGSYQKAPGEDHKSMLESIQGFKGRIQISLGTELVSEIEEAARLESKKDQVARLSKAVDEQIHRAYRLWPSNYIAVDLLAGNAGHRQHYTDQQKEFFIQRMEKRLDGLEAEFSSAGDREGVRGFFLGAYAKPVSNSR